MIRPLLLLAAFPSLAFAQELPRLGALPDDEGTITAHQVSPMVGPLALPAMVDLSAGAPSPGNQGPQGSCVGWATAYAAQSYAQGQANHWQPTRASTRFSPAWVYNQVNGGKDDGTTVGAALDLLKSKGADSLAYFPYVGSNYTRQPTGDSYARASRFRITGWSTLANDVQAIKQVLASGTPVIIRFEVFPDFDAMGPSNRVYNTSAGSSRGGHAVTLVGYDDSLAAFRLLNSWGTGFAEGGYGWIGYDFIHDGKLGFAAYKIDGVLGSESPRMHNLYVVQGGKLWRADREFGDYKQVSDADYTGATLASAGDKLYALYNGRVYEVDPFTGGRGALLGQGGAAVATAITARGETLLVLRGGNLFRVDARNGGWTPVGTGSFGAATQMAQRGEETLVLAGGRVQVVNDNTGASAPMGGAYPESGKLAVLGSTAYALAGDALVQIEANGAQTTISGGWLGATAMTALDGRVYITRANNLYSVDPVAKTAIALGEEGAWSGQASLAAISTTGLGVVHGSTLWRAAMKNGALRPLSNDDWSDTTAWAPLFGYVFAVQGATLFRLDPGNGGSAVIGSAGAFSGPTRMAASGSDLYMIQNNALRVVNTGTGASTQLGSGNWSNVDSLAYLDGALYATQGGNLLRVNTGDGSSSLVSSGNFAGARLVAHAGSLYAVAGAALSKVDTVTGVPARVGGDDWSGATSVTASDGQIYIAKSDAIYRVSLASGGATRVIAMDNAQLIAD